MAQKLLLADDSVTIQRVIELTFADEDIEVVSVGDGQQAIDRVATERPDIVLADVGMPRRDGYEVARFIKETPALGHIPVLLLTGAFEPIDEAKARAAGSDGVLAKPFEPQVLIARVKELLAAREGRAPAPAMAPESAAVRGASAPGPAAPPADPRALAAAPQAASQGMSLDEYFDRLDAAFANLSAPIPTPVPPADFGGAPGEALKPIPAALEDAGELDVDLSAWINHPGVSVSARSTEDLAAERESDESLSGSGVEWPTPAAPAEPGAPANAVPEPTAAVPAPGLLADENGPYGSPPLADAFAAFLAAEHGEPVPSSVAESFGHTLVVSDALIDQVSGKVLRRLADRTIEDTVADVVSQVAERVVREEIERLKATLR